ncbi:MAG TPA: acyltransferase family protein [Nocardioides sp.]|uniref:acyltransferase family protein n=1 Tax=uncultured Nocardioides sp. TaxID=198441 RepID=UPI00260FBC84|nr:acyltransferase family protein [uncultured Nocardioides sp.]HRD59659.1 acyltransferase family protein [Nocardioides sp.]HRI95229.1 acyltransferase family protein [Nocardioides sp.]
MRPGFRQDIQGLRALAVVLVILDHADIGPFHGGFIGVDVFFVISGFLITGLLVSEAERTGRASLLGFYARRARRILPAATLVIVVTVVASILFLSAVEATGVIQDALWATFFLANFKFASDGTDYFQNDTPPSPLQHYWSLSVEEQFYLVWPLLVLLLCVYAGWRARRSVGQRSLGPRVRDLGVSPLVVIVGISFAFSVSYSTTDPVAAYFSPFTRAWELALGALVACLSTRLILVKRSVQAMISWAGLIAVFAAALLYNGTTVFPGYAAALPVVGTAALLAGGMHAAGWGPQRLLSIRPMRAMGDWSYSLYLWHWPVLIIVAEAWHPLTAWQAAVLMLLVVPLSALSYHYVENPVRRARIFKGRKLRGVLLYPAVVLLTLPMLAAANTVVKDELDGGGPPITVSEFGQTQPQQDQVAALVQASVKAAQDGYEIPAGLKPSVLDLGTDIPDLGKCQYFEINSDRPLCPRGDTDGDRTLVLIGDSHARQWVPALDELAKRYGYTAYFLIREGCPSSDVTPWMVNGGPSTDCEAFQDWAREQVEELQPDVVLLGSEANRRGFATDDGDHVDDTDEMATMYREGMEREIDYLAPHTQRVIVIGDPPAVVTHPGRCLSERDATLAKCLSQEDKVSLVFIDSLRQAAAAKGVQFVETAAWFCADGLCPSVVGDYIAHRDRTHISQSYAGFLTDELEAQIHLDPAYVAPTGQPSPSPGTVAANSTGTP